MKPDPLFYRAQASNQQVEANAATLDNVRARNQRAADAWSALADRQDRAEAAHQARGASRAPAGLLSEASENPDRGHAAEQAADMR